MSATTPSRTSLVDVLDRSLRTGVAIRGDLVLSIADIDLVVLDLRVLLGSVGAFGPASVPPASSRNGERPAATAA